MRKFYIIAKKPEGTTGIICNAPRPIMGHKTWEGDFIHGIFYAEVMPSEEFADQMIETNTSLDAYELIYEDIDAAKNTLEKDDPRYVKYFDRMSDEQIISTYDRIKNG